mgnify:FL=1
MNDVKQEGDYLYIYTSKDAEEDGILVDITKINPDWKRGLFNYITSNLLNQGYIKEEKINIPNILDLLNQCLDIVRKKSSEFQDYDSFFCGKIEFPDGEKREVFIELNETGNFTIMLPEDR